MSLYERFTFRGKTLDRQTIAALLCAEKVLGYELTIVQGSYNTGVGASAGTHDGGGAVDLVWYDIKRKNRALRNVNFAGWPRPNLPGVWSAHWHGILIGNDKASSGAKAQIPHYKHGHNGLANDAKDAWPYRPKPIGPFRYRRRGPISWRRLNKIAKHPGGRATTPEGARQVEVVARALKGFNMSLGDHRKGRMDKPLIDAIHRFRRIRKVGATEVKGHLTPKVCYELCIPTQEEN